MKYFIFGLIMAGSLNAFAGGETGGGNAVVCYTSQAKQNMNSVELFDYWEQPQELNINAKLDMGLKGSVEDHVNFVLSRLEKFDPMRAAVYKNIANSILSNLPVYLQPMDFEKVADDNGTLIPPPPCYKTQFAVQIKKPKAFEKDFLINSKIWNSSATSNIIKAGIILHETIYREAILQGAESSDNSRYFNYIISSSYLNFASINDYETILNSAKLKFYKVVPIQIQDGPVVLVNNDSIQHPYTDVYFATVAAPAEYHSAQVNLILEPGTRIYLSNHSNKLISVNLIRINKLNTITLPDQSVHVLKPYPNEGMFGYDYDISQKGMWASLADDYSYVVDGKTISFTTKDCPYFDNYPEIHRLRGDLTETNRASNVFSADARGNLLRGCLARPTPLKISGSNDELIFTGHVEFDSRGHVKSGAPSNTIVAFDSQGDVTLNDFVEISDGAIKYPVITLFDHPKYHFKPLSGDEDAICNYLHLGAKNWDFKYEEDSSKWARMNSDGSVIFQHGVSPTITRLLCVTSYRQLKTRSQD